MDRRLPWQKKSCGSRSELGKGKVSNSVVASGRKHGRHVNSVTWVQKTEKELASVDTQVSLARKRLDKIVGTSDFKCETIKNSKEYKGNSKAYNSQTSCIA